jgi:hypothetical protein
MTTCAGPPRAVMIMHVRNSMQSERNKQNAPAKMTPVCPPLRPQLSQHGATAITPNVARQIKATKNLEKNKSPDSRKMRNKSKNQCNFVLNSVERKTLRNGGKNENSKTCGSGQDEKSAEGYCTQRDNDENAENARERHDVAIARQHESERKHEHVGAENGLQIDVINSIGEESRNQLNQSSNRMIAQVQESSRARTKITLIKVA